MVTVMNHRVMDNLSCMLLANDEFKVNTQARGGGAANMQAQLDAELARENALLRQQLLEAAADNGAISKSLQERVHSLSDMTDAKIRAETETKVLQVQGKSMQKDLESHKYELHLLRKQIQIRNEEKEHHKKASDASYKQHLENVKKIARLESECQRLRGLIRQRLPGPAAIAQMRAECDIHVKMGINSKKKSQSSSSLQAQREIEGLRERLLSVEDEAKFLKEAMTKRTTELQEARQLCARTAMKLAAAQALVESMTSVTSTVYSTPSTPAAAYLQSSVPLFDGDHLHGLPNQGLMMLQQSASACVNTDENHGVYASSTMHGDVNDGIPDDNFELKSASHNNDGELDEVSCAESWASALFAELSHLSNLHEDTNFTTSCGNRENHTVEETTLQFNTDKITILNDDMQKLDVNSALEMVHQRLSSVGETLLTSFKLTEANSSHMVAPEEINDSESLWDMRRNDANSSTCNDLNHDILAEILQIKGLLMHIDGAMDMGKLIGSTEMHSFGYMNGNGSSAYNEELIVKQEATAQISAMKGERGLSRLRCNSLEDEYDLSAKFSEEGDEIEHLGSKFSEQTDEMEDMGTKSSTKTAEIAAIGIEFSEQTSVMEARLGTNNSENTDMGSAIINEEIAKASDSGCDSTFVNNPTQFSEDLHKSGAKLAGTATSGPLNLAVPVEGSGVVSELAADVRLLHAAQDELELARGRIATLEAELARCQQEKADVVHELSDIRSLKQSLEAELACAIASMEDLKLQLSSRQVLMLAPNGDVSGGPPTLTHIDLHSNVKEEQELAAARAQLADCQRSIHVIRKQIATPEMQHLAFQDVINDDQVLFDTSPESSKSIDQNSHVPSPIFDNRSCFITSSLKTIIADPTADTVTQQGCNISYSSPLSKPSIMQEDGSSQPLKAFDGHATKQQIQQNLEQSKGHDADARTERIMYLTRSSSKDHAVKPPQNLSIPPKSLTTSRIAEFFNRAKSTTRGSKI